MTSEDRIIVRHIASCFWRNPITKANRARFLHESHFLLFVLTIANGLIDVSKSSAKDVSCRLRLFNPGPVKRRQSSVTVFLEENRAIKTYSIVGVN